MSGEYPYYGPTGILDYINEYRVDGKFVLIGEDGDHFLKFCSQEMTLLVDGKYNVNNHAHILSGNEKTTTDWLHLFYMHQDITLYLTRQGAGRFKLNKSSLLGLPIVYPRLKEEQTTIFRAVNLIRSNQLQSDQTLNKLRSLKTALMQDLLTGRVRVTPLLNNMEVKA
jgi:type I restriction enzyme S subunit